MPAQIIENTIVTDEGCWLYVGGSPNDSGYRRYGQQYVHRLAYLQLVGPVSDGSEIDHVCHDPKVCAGGDSDPHRSCWNPTHLEALSIPLNRSRQAHPNARKTHCKRGHELTPENVYVIPSSGSRQCRACVRERTKR